jgi:hypothetical protein
VILAVRVDRAQAVNGRVRDGSKIGGLYELILGLLEVTTMMGDSRMSAHGHLRWPLKGVGRRQECIKKT